MLKNPLKCLDLLWPNPVVVVMVYLFIVGCTIYREFWYKLGRH